MSRSKKGCHIRTKIPMSTYTFKWTIENFSKLLVDKTITSSDFYPCSGVRWYSTLTKCSSFLLWVMENPTGQSVSVDHKISVVDTSGKLWFKDKKQQTYNSNNKQCVLITHGNTINITDIYSLTKDVLTFSCFMTFVGDNIETDAFELESNDGDNRNNLEKLSNDLKTMYGVSLYTDVCLRIGCDSLRAHKAILCGRSPVFAKMFEHKLEEKETSAIDIADLEMNVLKDLISFIYTASVPNEDFDSVYSLYYAADKYGVEDLRQLCGEVLLSKLTVDNASQVLALADRHSDQTLKNSVLTFMDIYLEAIMATDSWRNLIDKETKLAAEVMQKRSEKKSSKGNEEIFDPAVRLAFRPSSAFGSI